MNEISNGNHLKSVFKATSNQIMPRGGSQAVIPCPTPCWPCLAYLGFAVWTWKDSHEALWAQSWAAAHLIEDRVFTCLGVNYLV